MLWRRLTKHKRIFVSLTTAICLLLCAWLRVFYLSSAQYADIVYSTRGNIFLLDTETYWIWQLTFDGSNSAGSWSPDGSRIAFMSSRDDVVSYEERRYRSPNSEIYLIDVDGTNLMRLTYNDVGDWGPIWSPDGRQLAFISSCDHLFQSHGDLYIMNADGTHLRNLSNTCGYNVTHRWSPDGDYIVYSTVNEDIFIVEVATDSVLNLTGDNPTADRSPEFSPDGARIVFESARSGCFDIYTISLDGSDLQQVTNSAECDINPIWSPDGRWIAFTTRHQGFSSSLQIVDVENSTVQYVHTEADGLIGDTAWSPDSQYILFLVDGIYYRFNLDGSNVSVMLGLGDSFLSLSWRP